MKDYKLGQMFPTMVYVAHKKPPLSSLELENIKSIKTVSKKSLQGTVGHITENSYIFDTNKLLTPLKEFCELHIKQYVEELIKPKNELDFYITQSWLSVTPPGGNHGAHQHPNSIISGIFCVQACENDELFFHDNFFKFKNSIEIEGMQPPAINLISCCSYPVTENILFLRFSDLITSNHATGII